MNPLTKIAKQLGITGVEVMIIFAIVGILASVIVGTLHTHECLKRGGHMEPTGGFTTNCYGPQQNLTCHTEPTTRCVEPKAAKPAHEE